MLLLFLYNIIGFMVGIELECQGVIKYGLKMIQVVVNVCVFKLILVVGGFYGVGNYVMCGCGFDLCFIFVWLNSCIVVMGGVQVGKVLCIVIEEKYVKEGKEVDLKMFDMLEIVIVQKFDSQFIVFYGIVSLWDDGLVDLCDSCRLFGYLLDICVEVEVWLLKGNSFGVVRF